MKQTALKVPRTLAFWNKYLAAFIVAVLLFSSASAQQDSAKRQPINAYYQWTGGGFTRLLSIPQICPTLAVRDSGAIAYCDRGINFWTGYEWRPIAKVVDDTTLVIGRDTVTVGGTGGGTSSGYVDSVYLRSDSVFYNKAGTGELFSFKIVSSVTTDATLIGDGTSGDPLGADTTNYIATKHDLNILGKGISYTYSTTAPTDTGKIWIKTPSRAAVYDAYIYLGNWKRFAYLDSITGVFTTKKPLTIFTSGQSNSIGYTPGTDKGDTARVPGVIVFDNVNNTWEQAAPGSMSPPFHQSVPSNNLTFQVAKRLQKEGIADIVRFAIAGEGGLTINNWIGNYPSGGSTRMMDSIRQIITRSGIDSIDVFLWQQGESYVVRSPTAIGGYWADMKVLFDSLNSPLTPSPWINNYTKFVATSPAVSMTDTFAISSAGSPVGALQRFNTDRNVLTGFVDGFGIDTLDGAHWTGPGTDSLAVRTLAVIKEMPRPYESEIPKWSYDYLNQKDAFPFGRTSAYANTYKALNIGSERLLLIAGTSGVPTRIGAIDMVSGGFQWGDPSNFTTTKRNFNLFGTTLQNGALLIAPFSATLHPLSIWNSNETIFRYRIDSLNRIDWGGQTGLSSIGTYRRLEGNVGDTTTGAATETITLITPVNNTAGTIHFYTRGKASDLSDVYYVARVQRFTKTSGGTLTLLGSATDTEGAEQGLTGAGVSISVSGGDIQISHTGIAGPPSIWWRTEYKLTYY